MADTALAGGGPAPAASGPPRDTGPAAARPLLRGAGIALLLLGVVVLGFAGYLYGLSGVQEARSQAILFTRLQLQLSGQDQQVPPAPLGPTTQGSPVAVLNIPGIGVRDLVVVEGTSPGSLSLGPGHLRSTPLPGQAGVAEVFGRRATFGGPFGRLPQLRPGDVIRAITGQGQSTYRVAAITDSAHVIEDPAPNRLLLLTASSPLVPGSYLQVDADLVSTAHPGPGAARVINPPELPLAGDSGALTTAVLWALALALVSAAGTGAALRWSLWPAYLATAPLALAVLWNLYTSVAALLPNLY